MLTYFYESDFFLLMQKKKNVYICQSAFVMSSLTVVNAKYRYWGASLEFVIFVMIQELF